MKHSVDICVVLFNSLAHVDALASSLTGLQLNGSIVEGASQKDEIEVSLYVLDNASSDDGLERLKNALVRKKGSFIKVEFVRERSNLGFGVGQNKLVTKGDSQWIFVLNPDAWPRENCLVNLIEATKLHSHGVAFESRQAPYEHPKSYKPDTLEPPWCTAAGVLLKRETFENVGGFDPQIFLYAEDVDLSFRLRAAGGQLVYVPTAVIDHASYQYENEVKPLQLVHSYRGNLMLRTRYGSWRNIVEGFLIQIGFLAASLRRDAVVSLWAALKEVVITKFSWLRRFSHFRQKTYRNLDIDFNGLNYEVRRSGAFHDISEGTRLEPKTLVSILIRTVGRQQLLEQALISVVNQTYQNIEVVIVEDGPETLTAFLQDERFKTLNISYHAQGENFGRSQAGNKALEMAKGDYIGFLDEDDMFYADHVEQLHALAVTKGERLVYSFAQEIPTEFSNDGQSVVEEFPAQEVFKKAFDIKSFFESNYIPINTVLFHRSYYEKCGGFNESLDLNEDWDLWLRFVIQGGRFFNLAKTTCLYRVPNGLQYKARENDLIEAREFVREQYMDVKLEMAVRDLVFTEPVAATSITKALEIRYPRFKIVFTGVRRLYHLMIGQS